MALSDVGLCARALIRLGAKPITSFDDGTSESEVAGQLFGPLRDAVLSSFGWSFATAQVALTPLVTPPLADFSCAYQLPNDFLRALSAGSGSAGRGVRYRLYQNTLHADASPLTLTYIYRPESETFPPYFDMALITRLAAEFCVPVTENVSRAEALYRLSEQELARARQVDSQQATVKRLQDFNLVTVRK